MAERIFVVEDEEAYRETIRYLLEKNGYDVAVAANGADAVKDIARFDPDLIILDLMLPRVSGFEVFRRVTKNSSPAVIMVTARGDEDSKIAGLELGADDYIAKPFSGRELLARVKAVLRRSAPVPEESFDDADVLSVRGFTLDPQRLILTREEMEVSLPPKECALLYTLMESPGRVRTRESLISRVWGEDYYGGTKTLDVHIKRLRSKIEPTPAIPQFIRTIRGVGYVFESPERDAGASQ